MDFIIIISYLYFQEIEKLVLSRHCPEPDLEENERVSGGIIREPDLEEYEPIFPVSKN